MSSTHHTPKKVTVTCKVTLTTAKARTAVRWQLVRGRRIYAHGKAYGRRGRATVQLPDAGSLPRGRYLLRILGARPTQTTVRIE